MVDRFWAYLNDSSTQAEDPSVKSTDRRRLKGYIMKWRSARILIGAALYTDALKPASILSLTLQDDHVNIVQGL